MVNAFLFLRWHILCDMHVALAFAGRKSGRLDAAAPFQDQFIWSQKDRRDRDENRIDCDRDIGSVGGIGM